jgi:hypothetical protein
MVLLRWIYGQIWSLYAHACFLGVSCMSPSPFLVVKKTSVTVCEDLYKTLFVVHCQILAQSVLWE